MMRRTGAVTLRVWQQLSHDRRSIALIVVMPTVLLAVFSWVFDHQPAVFVHVGPALIGFFPFTIFFLITSVTMVRERTSGTLERLMSTPIERWELMAGYALALSTAALAQAFVTTVAALWWLDLEVEHPVFLLVFAVAAGVVGTSMGLAASAFARTEFQAAQFVPLAIIPQFLVCGLLVPRDQMPRILSWFSELLPLSHLTDGLLDLVRADFSAFDALGHMAIQALFVTVFLVAASLTLPRRTA